MSSITTVIMVRNEERNIARAIEGVRGLGPVIIADTGSTDRTREIAESMGAKVFRIEWKGYGRSRREACGLALTEYILSIDADEIVSDRLAREIRRAAAAGSIDGCFLPRVTNFCGSWILHSGWHPEFVLRFFRNGSGSFTEDVLHESFLCHGKTGRLAGWLLHYSYPDIGSYLAKLDDYARLGGGKYLAEGGRLAILRLLINPPVWFLKKFVFRLGFADGVAGLWIAALTAAGQVLKYAYALRRQDL